MLKKYRQSTMSLPHPSGQPLPSQPGIVPPVNGPNSASPPRMVPPSLRPSIQIGVSITPPVVSRGRREFGESTVQPNGNGLNGKNVSDQNTPPSIHIQSSFKHNFVYS